jgi:hypothetical protein
MAKMVTKRFKKEAFYEFLEARRKTWYWLFAVLIIQVLLSYPTPIIQKFKDPMMGLNDKQRVKLDETTLFFFYMGIYEER